jgi:tripartite-type tricarboxylate transporter receptor subunit TctC
VNSFTKRLLAVVAAFTFVVTAACAQDYPKRPITLIVPFAAGGNSDVIARTVAEQMGTARADHRDREYRRRRRLDGAHPCRARGA